MTARFVLHHHPMSRAQRIKWLLEEVGAPFEIVPHDLEAKTHKTPDFLAINPGGKIPALVDRGPDGTANAAVSESLAIMLHIVDACPEAGLAPTPGTPERGPFLTWMVYAGTAMEPAFTDMMFPRVTEPAPSMLGWPSFDETLDRVLKGLESGPWLMGERFSAADVQVGSFLGWLAGWGKLPGAERFAGYLEQIAARPAHQRASGRT